MQPEVWFTKGNIVDRFLTLYINRVFIKFVVDLFSKNYFIIKCSSERSSDFRIDETRSHVSKVDIYINEYTIKVKRACVMFHVNLYERNSKLSTSKYRMLHTDITKPSLHPTSSWSSSIYLPFSKPTNWLPEYWRRMTAFITLTITHRICMNSKFLPSTLSQIPPSVLPVFPKIFTHNLQVDVGP